MVLLPQLDAPAGGVRPPILVVMLGEGGVGQPPPPPLITPLPPPPRQNTKAPVGGRQRGRKGPRWRTGWPAEARRKKMRSF